MIEVTPNHVPGPTNSTRFIYVIPTRGFIGYRCEFQHDTKGTGVINNIFHSYADYAGHMEKNNRGALISLADGDTTYYALNLIEERGVLFVGPGTWCCCVVCFVRFMCMCLACVSVCVYVHLVCKAAKVE